MHPTSRTPPLDYRSPSSLPAKLPDNNVENSFSSPTSCSLATYGLSTPPIPPSESSTSTPVPHRTPDDGWGSWTPSTSSVQAGATAFQRRVAITGKTTGVSGAVPLMRKKEDRISNPTFSRSSNSVRSGSPLHSSVGSAQGSNRTSQVGVAMGTAETADDGWGSWEPRAQSDGESAYQHRQKMSSSTTFSSARTSPEAPVGTTSTQSGLVRSAISVSPNIEPSFEHTAPAAAKSDPTSDPAPPTVDDPWASWSAGSQAEQGGASAFLARQRMGTGERIDASLLPVRSALPASPLQKAVGGSAPPSKSKKKKKGPAAFTEGKKAVKARPSLSKPPSSPITKIAVPSCPSSPRTSETSSVSFIHHNEAARSTQFPAGSLLAQIANSGSPRQQASASLTSKANAVNTETSHDGRGKTLDKVRELITELRSSRSRVNKLKFDIATQTMECSLLPSIDLLSSDPPVNPPEAASQSKGQDLLSDLEGLSFVTGESFYTAKDGTPCLLDDDSGPSDGGSPVTPLQPLKTLSWFSSATTSATKPKIDLPSSSTPLPEPRSTKLENAVASLGHPSSMASRILDLLKTLPKRDQAMCLFNKAFLEAKVADALLVIAAEDESEEEL